jgi:membrane-associated protease RseP (regulator of RpoE activity)
VLSAGLLVGNGIVSAAPPFQQPTATPTVQAKGLLGVTLRVDGERVIVQSVTPDGPAAKAGIQANDQITTIGGTAVKTVREAQDALARYQPNSQVQIGILRGNANQVVTVTLGSAPAGRGGGSGPQGARENIPFDNLRGGTRTYVDSAGRTVTITEIAGKVASVNAAQNQVTVNKNGGGTETYTVDANTRLGGVRSIADLQPNDQVMVSTSSANSNASLATAIVKVGGVKISGGLPGGRGPRGGQPGQGTPRTPGAQASPTPTTTR